jgi:hypothetical protein
MCLKYGDMTEEMRYIHVQCWRIMKWITEARLEFIIFRDRRLPSRLNWILPSSGLLRGVKLLEPDVSELPVDLIFEGQAAQEEFSLLFLFIINPIQNT